MMIDYRLPFREGYEEYELPNGDRAYRKIVTEQDRLISELREQSAMLADTLDTVLTEILPVLMGM